MFGFAQNSEDLDCLWHRPVGFEGCLKSSVKLGKRTRELIQRASRSLTTSTLCLGTDRCENKPVYPAWRSALVKPGEILKPEVCGCVTTAYAVAVWVGLPLQTSSGGIRKSELFPSLPGSLFVFLLEFTWGRRPWAARSTHGGGRPDYGLRAGSDRAPGLGEDHVLPGHE